VKESLIEAAFRAYCLSKGLWCIKLWPFMVGLPDRLVVGPNRLIFFLELKAPGQQPNALQLRRLDQLREWGFTATWADNLEDAKRKLDEAMHGIRA